MDKLKGKAKEMAGKLSGDDRAKSEGRTDQMKGKTKDSMSEGKERMEGVRDSLKDRKDKGDR